MTAPTALAWGILGTGKIAATFAEGIAASETGTLLAVGSRSQETADHFADRYAAPRRYAAYEALLADPEIQAIYISLPNHLHAEWTIKCALAGKHILCEKPFTTNYGEAMTVLAEVERHGVFLMEAFMYRCHPQTARLLDLIEAGTVGEVRLIEASFSYNMGPQYENIRLSNAAAGGAIMDVGCYTASLARLVAAEPIAVKGVAHIGATSRVDEWAAASLRFPNGAVATLTCGTQVATDSSLHIWGSEGSIHVPNPWKPVRGANRIDVQRGDEREEIVVEGPNELYAIEADTVARYLTEREAPRPCMTWADTLGNMRVLDQWRRAVGLTFDVERPAALRRPAPSRRADAPMVYGRIAGIEHEVSRLILGSVPLSSDDMPAACAMLDHFVSLGGNAVDTARNYGDETEEAVGAWMRLRANRSEIVLVGKGAHPDRGGPRVDRDAIAADLEASLQRLQTDYIDLYLLHRDDPSVPVGEIVAWLNEHYQAGRIHAFGGSNWTVERLQAANDYARAHGLVPFAAGSPNFSLALWNPGEPPWAGCLAASVEGKEWYVERQFPLLAWSSQAQGFFTGRYSEDDRSDAEMVRVWYNHDNFARLERARELAVQKGSSATAIALAYVLAQPFPTFALIGPHSIQELDSSAQALHLSLTPEELRWLSGLE